MDIYIYIYIYIYCIKIKIKIDQESIKFYIETEIYYKLDHLQANVYIQIYTYQCWRCYKAVA